MFVSDNVDACTQIQLSGSEMLAGENAGGELADKAMDDGNDDRGVTAVPAPELEEPDTVTGAWHFLCCSNKL